jgi:hypothetical protein
MTQPARHQQPIFAAKPGLVMQADAPLPCLADRILHEPANPSRVTPQCVFAAGKRAFDVVVRDCGTLAEAKVAIYADLPLHLNGWTYAEMKVRRLRSISWGVIYRVERG